MLNIYKNFGKLPFLQKYNLIANPAWFVYSAIFAVLAHDLFFLVLMVVFGVLWLLSLRNSKQELAWQADKAKRDAQYQAVLDDLFKSDSGRKDDAA